MREVLVARVELHGHREESEHRKRQEERDESKRRGKEASVTAANRKEGPTCTGSQPKGSKITQSREYSFDHMLDRVASG